MHLKAVKFHGFKRFTDLTIDGLPASARLIVLAGPNGSGKSSFFDGLKTWHWTVGGPGASWDETYGAKIGAPSLGWGQRVEVEFHEVVPVDDERKKLVYVRSAFRNEADFGINGINRLASPLDSPRVTRLIDTDQSVSDNYQRLILQTLDGVYSDALPEGMTRIELRDRVIGQIRTAMAKVFPDLQLDGVGGVLNGSQVGTFYFTKGSSTGFLYKNLSAGEKAAFDLILDAVVKADFFNNSVWCIDEPETHLNTRVQGLLLETLVDLLPADSQLVLASHSIGFMRKAWEMAKASPGSVVFLDMQGVDFDSPVTMRPVEPSREFWSRTLDVALGDLAQLMAPERVVLCEGKPSLRDEDQHAAFDAGCYRTIFSANHPDTDFISVGSSSDVRNQRLDAGRAIQTIASGTEVVRLIDRDLLSDDEVAELRSSGIHVLSRRNIEAYLFDDEILIKLCTQTGQPDKTEEALSIKMRAIEASIARGNDVNDLKSAAGDVYNGIRKLLALTNAGSDWMAFARSILAPMVTSETAVYSTLEDDIFG